MKKALWGRMASCGRLIIGLRDRATVVLRPAPLQAALLAALVCGLAWAQAFTFEIASPVAAQDYRFKTAAFVFRVSGCPESRKIEVSATAEGSAGGTRRSTLLRVMESRPGVYGIERQWDAGRWVVVLKGSCGSDQAGAIVPIGPRGFVREASKTFSHPPTADEIEAALKAIPEGGYK
jgi:hypothetical protein